MIHLVWVKRLLLSVTLWAGSIPGCGEPKATPNPGSSEAGGAVPQLTAGNVPADLQDLVSLAQRWGIGDDVLRSKRVGSATEAERSQLRAAFTPRQARITAWLDSFGQGIMPDEAAAFMYTQLAIEEMP